MATSYATVAELEKRLRRTIPSDQVEYAETAIEDASLEIDVNCPLPDEPTDQDLQARLVVVCRMIKRAYAVPDEAVGVGSVQQGAGPYQSTLTFSNPAGDMYLTKADRRLLGCGGQKAFMIDLTPQQGGLGPHAPECSLHFGGDHCTCGYDIAGFPIFSGAS